MEIGSHKIEQTIIGKAKDLGASLAGIASVEDLKASPSLEIYSSKPYYEEFDPESSDYFKFTGFNWGDEYQSILVWALEHPASEPVMDWWSLKVPGFTPGNRILRAQSKKLRIWMAEELSIKAFSLPYQIEFGGIFLKDCAVLAGLGVIGKNNLLITPEFGPRVRLRGIFIEDKLTPTGPINFDPCNGCPMPCQQACPQDAYRSGTFGRSFCKIENDKRYANEEMLEGEIMGIDEPSMVMKPCRFCELACPVGRNVSLPI